MSELDAVRSAHTYAEAKSALDAAGSSGLDLMDWLHITREIETRFAEDPAVVALKAQQAAADAEGSRRYGAWLDEYHRSVDGLRFLLESAARALSRGEGSKYEKLAARIVEVTS